MSSELKVQDDFVVSMEYTLHVDGEILDTSQGSTPLAFIQGIGNIIPGLERELYGMQIGESKNVIVPAADGYGEHNTEAFIEVPRDQFPKGMELEIGGEIQVTDQDGQIAIARIDSIAGDTIRLDFNHPLAGKELHFDVTIVALRPANDEELAHGHVHDGHTH